MIVRPQAYTLWGWEMFWCFELVCSALLIARSGRLYIYYSGTFFFLKNKHWKVFHKKLIHHYPIYCVLQIMRICHSGMLLRNCPLFWEGSTQWSIDHKILLKLCCNLLQRDLFYWFLCWNNSQKSPVKLLCIITSVIQGITLARSNPTYLGFLCENQMDIYRRI